MLKSIVNYVNYNYQFCENIDSPFLSNDEKANECFIVMFNLQKSS